MRCFLFILTLIIIFHCPAEAQLNKGTYRIGLAGEASTVGRPNMAMIDVSFGDLVADNLEILIDMETTFYGWLAATGEFKAGFIYHFSPAKKIIPGIGLSAGLPFSTGEQGTQFVLDLFFNLYNFVSDDWALNLKAGYEKQYNDQYAREPAIQGMVVRFGISTFWRKKK